MASTILMGKDRLAFLYLGQAVRMVAELSASYPLDRPHIDKDEARAVDNTLLGVYNLIAFDYLSRSRLEELASVETCAETFCFFPE